ncbi:MAG TPA: Amuc_1102 family pilus-like protein [Chthoniobacterales bacterium]|nr:Amuc_1102 family pilus-like protein [Chthoniobacterales bacterium]
MRLQFRFGLLSVGLFLPGLLVGQTRSAREFQLTRITRNFISSPQFTYAGAEAFPVDTRQRWLQVEAEFTAAPPVTDELTLKYFVLFNATVFTAEVTHTNVLAGRERRSVIYMPPRTVARFTPANRPLGPNSVQNIAVQIVRQGTVKDELSLNRAAVQWYASMPQVSGLLLNKSETPFAPLYWDRYEQIKSSGR